MKVTFLWLTMGAYHVARMNALAEKIGADCLKVIEICPVDDHNWNTSLLDKHFNYQCILENEVLSSGSLKKAVSKLLKILDSDNADVIVNGCGYFDWNLRKVIKEIKTRHQTKMVLWSETTLNDNPNPWYKLLIKKWMVSVYDAALTAGHEHSKFLKKIGFDKDSIGVVGNVVANSVFHRSEDIKRKKIVLFVGRFLKIKNVITLLEAFNRIKNEVPDWNLQLIGDGEEKNKILNFIKKKDLEKRVILPGLLQPQEILPFYHQASLFVLPSFSEPWGLVANEAMAAGLPVIISKQSGVSEIIKNGENGLIFDAFNVEGLVQALKVAIADEALRMKLSKNGIENISKFTPEKYAEKVTHFLSKWVLR